MIGEASRSLYCHCAYAKVVPPEVKAAVLSGLAEAHVAFDAVPDLCEMAAHGDDRLREIAAAGPLTIAACYPRAVKWLFAAAGAHLPDDSVRIWNMRVESAETVIAGLVTQTGQTGESGQDVESRQDGDAGHGETEVPRGDGLPIASSASMMSMRKAEPAP
jgi:hypothetical protein